MIGFSYHSIFDLYIARGKLLFQRFWWGSDGDGDGEEISLSLDKKGMPAYICKKTRENKLVTSFFSFSNIPWPLLCIITQALGGSGAAGPLQGAQE